MKGVILAGGTGTRLDPLTRITNKHLLPVYDRPMVTYAIDALAKAGVEEVMLVTGAEHAEDFFRILGNGHEFGIRWLAYAYQERAGGSADALALARPFGGGERVVVMLADNVYGEPVRPFVERFLAQEEGARVLLARMEKREHLRHLGVPRLDDGRIVEIVEKPADPPSSYAVTGLYCYDARVWEIVEGLTPSERGELEITDVNNWYVERGLMEFDTAEGFWGDAGESIDAYYAVVDWVRGKRR
ncbi:MAG: NTP transferase domain-containing protein [Actinobacteria bacterium]|nr:NTP transferase domain-containing protein [Actinomycetota bacterium]